MPSVREPPTRTGRRAYAHVRPLGAGSFGLVSLVISRTTGEQLVLKEVQLRGLAANELKRAREEVLVLRRLHHPSLISYHDSFIDASVATLFIVMDFADGGDLQSAIRERRDKSWRFKEVEVLRMFVECCDALAYCHHELHLLHRDLKPANIMLTSAGHVKIGDFGLSRSLAHSSAMAQTKAGTALYMAPEICEGKEYDRGADVWSLGVTLYEVCSLREPWLDQMGGRGMLALYRTISTQQLNLDEIATRYSMALVATLRTLLEREPFERPSFKALLTTPLLATARDLAPLLAQRSGDGSTMPGVDGTARDASLSASGDDLETLRSEALSTAVMEAAAGGGHQAQARGARASRDSSGSASEELTLWLSVGTDAHLAASTLQRQWTFSRGRSGHLVARDDDDASEGFFERVGRVLQNCVRVNCSCYDLSDSMYGSTRWAAEKYGSTWRKEQEHPFRNNN